ncbi:MAG: carbohydrate ABC transporter permease [Eubacteriales bacterium]|nr:carbohydrate ABC transporter permease [Eubacteriales bacterium]
MKNHKISAICLVLIGLLFLFPIYILFMTSFKSVNEIFVVSLWPQKATLGSLQDALKPDFIRSVKNSLFVSVTVTVVAMILHAMCGYAVARMKFPGKTAIFTMIISTLMIPTTTILVPLFMVCKAIGITNSYSGLIIPAFFNAYGIFLFHQFYLDFPGELEEAAEVEGCSRLKMFFQIVLPLSKPMIVPLTIAFFLGTWNNYLWPLIVNKKAEYYTVQVYLANLVSGYGTPWNILIASAALAAVPVFILFLCMQRQLVDGIKATGIK